MSEIYTQWNDYENDKLIKLKDLGLTYSVISIEFNKDEKCNMRTAEALRKHYKRIMTERILSDTKDTLIKQLKQSPKNIKDLASILEIDEDEIVDIIKNLSEKSTPISITNNGNVELHNNYIIPLESKHEKIDDLYTENQNEFSVGIIGDTHIGSKTCDIDALNRFYDYVKNNDIKYVLHAGDMTDGIGIYSGQQYEQSYIGLDQQANACIKFYPKRNDVTTITIVGNHDYSFIQKSGTDIIHHISLRRSDIKCCGIYQGVVNINGVRFKLHHPDGGLSYSISYKIQKFLESMSDKPDVFIVGHYHQSLVIHGYNSVPLAMMPGSFQRETSFSTRKGFRNIIGGYILTVKKSKFGNEYITKWIDLY